MNHLIPIKDIRPGFVVRVIAGIKRPYVFGDSWRGPWYWVNALILRVRR